MNVERLSSEFTPVHEGIEELRQKEDEIEGMLVLLQNKNGNYTFWVAGIVGAESTIGRLEVVKRALLARIKE